MIEHLAGVVAVILLIWSAALLWASWQIAHMTRQLARERREIKRWIRLKTVYDSQRSKWH